MTIRRSSPCRRSPGTPTGSPTPWRRWSPPTGPARRSTVRSSQSRREHSMAVKGPSEVDPKHMMRGINNVGAGWHPLVRELEAKLLEMDQSYILDQIKEKFGGLRYYATNSTTKVDYAAFHALIHAAEGDSF